VYQRGSSPLHQPLETIVPAALQETIERVHKCVEAMSVTDDARLVKDARQCAIRLKRARLLQSETELRYLLKEAEDVGDVATGRLLRHQFMVVRRELLTINSAMRLHG
jgi:DNA primase